MKLTSDFFGRSDVVNLAREMLGMVLVTEFEGRRTSGIITEAEAYRAPDDLACHARHNRRTPRTEVMFWEGGHAYVYLSYGIHSLFNVVTGPDGMAQVVLVRAIEPLEGIETMLARRGHTQLKPATTSGPGSLAVALGIGLHHNGTPMLAADSPIFLEDRGIRYPDSEVQQAIRVGVENCGESARWPWRFYVRPSRFVTKRGLIG